jgi:four helix bundle protein
MSTPNEKPYDLEERSALFGVQIIDFAKSVPVNKVTERLIPQIVGAGTSVGANYCEADDAVSKKEFKNKIGTCKKEAREAKFFVRMIVRAVPELREPAKPVWKEANEFHLIFAKIWRSS